MDFWKVNWLKNGESYTAIAKSLGRSTSTISREVNSFIEEQIQRLPGRKRDKNRQRVNIPAIASLNSRKYRGQVMVSTIRKAKLKLRMAAGTNLPANRRPTGRPSS